MRIRSIQVIAVAILTASITFAAELRTKIAAPPNWNRSAAAQYLDTRQQYWMDWQDAQRDHGTACVSCHTTIPYALGRPSLHTRQQAAFVSSGGTNAAVCNQARDTLEGGRAILFDGGTRTTKD